MTRSRTALGLLVLVVGVLLFLFLSNRQQGIDAGGAEMRAPEMQTPGAALHGPKLDGVPPERPPAPAKDSRWIVRAHVKGLRPGQESECRISVNGLTGTGIGPSGPTGAVRAEAAGALAELDVSRLVRTPAVALLEVFANAPSHMPGGAHYQLPDADEALAAGGVIEVTITLREAAVLRGRMLGPDGLPRAGFVQALVDPRGPLPQREEVGISEPVGPDGRFRCRVADLAEPALALRAIPPDSGSGALLPAIAGPWHATVGRETDVGDITLESGIALRGRIEGATERMPASLAAHCLVRRSFMGPELETWQWTPGGPVCRVLTLAPGNAEFSLEPMRQGVWQVDAIWTDWGAALAQEVCWGGSRVVDVPGGPLVIDVRRSLLRVLVTGSGRPVENATVIVEGAEALAFQTDSAGGGAVVFPPHTSLHVRAWAKGHEPQTAQVVTPSHATEHMLHLDLPSNVLRGHAPADWEWTLHAPSRVTMTVHAVSASDVDLHARLRLFDEQGARIGLTWIERQGVVTWRTDERLVGHGWAECVTALPRGPLTLEVEAPGHITRRHPFTYHGPSGGVDVPTFAVLLEPR